MQCTIEHKSSINTTRCSNAAHRDVEYASKGSFSTDAVKQRNATNRIHITAVPHDAVIERIE